MPDWHERLALKHQRTFPSELPASKDADSCVAFEPHFDPDGKNVDSSKYKESIQGGFDFAKIKALAERIFGAKPKEE